MSGIVWVLSGSRPGLVVWFSKKERKKERKEGGGDVGLVGVVSFQVTRAMTRDDPIKLTSVPPPECPDCPDCPDYLHQLSRLTYYIDRTDKLIDRLFESTFTTMAITDVPTYFVYLIYLHNLHLLHVCK